MLGGLTTKPLMNIKRKQKRDKMIRLNQKTETKVIKEERLKLIDILNSEDSWETKGLLEEINNSFTIVISFFRELKEINIMSINDGSKELCLKIWTNMGISNEKIVEIINEVINE